MTAHPGNFTTISKTHIIVWSAELLDSVFPLSLLSEQLVDFVVKIADAELAQAGCRPHAKYVSRVRKNTCLGVSHHQRFAPSSSPNAWPAHRFESAKPFLKPR